MLMNGLQNLAQIPTLALFILYIWSVIWKGLALWKAANLKQRNWFIAILILNTVGILEIAYLFFFAQKKMKLSELEFWKSK